MLPGVKATIQIRGWVVAALIFFLSSSPQAQTQPNAQERNAYEREWNGARDNLVAGVDADDYWKSCSIDPSPGHPTVADPNLRSIICLKWMLLWGEYLASFESGALEGATVERPRGRRYLIKAFGLLRADLDHTPTQKKIARLLLYRQLDLQVEWYKLLMDRGPETPAMRAAALDYYLAAWNVLPNAPHEVSFFEYKFDIGEAIKHLFDEELFSRALDNHYMEPIQPELFGKLVEFLKSAYDFHLLPFPPGADPKGRRYIEAVLINEDGWATPGIAYGVFPGSPNLQTLPILASTDLRSQGRLLARAQKLKLVDDRVVSAEVDELDKLLLRRQIDDIKSWIERRAARGDQLGVIDRHRELRDLYQKNGDLVGRRNEQEVIIALAHQIGDRGLIARETVERGVVEYEAGQFRDSLADLESARDTALETAEGEFFVRAIEYSESARLNLGMPSQPAEEQRFVYQAADAVTVPSGDIEADPTALTMALRQWLDQPGHLQILRTPAEARLALALYKLHEYAEAEAIFDRVIPRLQQVQAKGEELASLYFLLAIEAKRANLGRFYGVLARCERTRSRTARRGLGRRTGR